jgi:hypothetical protein
LSAHAAQFIRSLEGQGHEIRLGAGESPRYQVRIIDDTTDYRIAINVKSKLEPSEVEYVILGDEFARRRSYWSSRVPQRSY